mmetsp:Transcript_27316/g.45819  ORF Transcript_27316/g.45819 Transcript_27316/m.45819 type:complete len:260 (+) Transcript_27316:107-886(+)
MLSIYMSRLVFKFLCIYSSITYALNATQKVFYLGWPKTGTASLHYYLECHGLRGYHYFCGSFRHNCGDCIARAVISNSTIEKSCGFEFDFFAEMNYIEPKNADRCIFPQMQYLGWLYKAYPTAKYVYIYREPEAWFNSVHYWPGLEKLLLKCMDKFQIPKEEGASNYELLHKWYEDHLIYVKDFFKDKVGKPLVLRLEEKDITFEQQLDAFLRLNVDSKKAGKCWHHTHHNKGAEKGTKIITKYNSSNINDTSIAIKSK